MKLCDFELFFSCVKDFHLVISIKIQKIVTMHVYKQVAGAVSIDIRGAKGPNAITINGTYDPTDEICNDWPVYQKRGDPNKWMEFFNQ